MKKGRSECAYFVYKREKQRYYRGDEIVICLVKVYIKEQGLSFSIANVHNLSILFGHDLLNFFETIF